ncbi:hypothetical protein GCM10022209_54130 [Chitinophaga oryziterrae]
MPGAGKIGIALEEAIGPYNNIYNAREYDQVEYDTHEFAGDGKCFLSAHKFSGLGDKAM